MIKMSEFKIYVPKFHNLKVLGLFKRATNRKKLYSKVLNSFKGFTILNGNLGFWKNDKNEVFKDDIEIIQIFTHYRNENKIKSICEYIKGEFSQESVLYTKGEKEKFI